MARSTLTDAILLGVLVAGAMAAVGFLLAVPLWLSGVAGIMAAVLYAATGGRSRG